MDLFSAASRAAGQVGTAYVANVVNKQIEEKKQARLMQLQKEKFSEQKQLEGMQFQHNQTIEDTRFQHNQQISTQQDASATARWKAQREATASDVQGFQDLGSGGIVPYGRAGILGQAIPGSKQSYSEKAQLQFVQDRIKELDTAQAQNSKQFASGAIEHPEYSANKAEYDRRRILLDAERRAIWAPNEGARAKIMQEAHDKAEVAPHIPTLVKKWNGDLNAAVADAQKTGISQENIDAMKRLWPKSAVPTAGDNTASAPPQPGQSRLTTASDVWAQGEAQQNEKWWAGVHKWMGDQKVMYTVAQLKEHARRMKGPVSPIDQTAVRNNYEFIMGHLDKFNLKEIKRFNLAVKALNKANGTNVPLFTTTGRGTNPSVPDKVGAGTGSW